MAMQADNRNTGNRNTSTPRPGGGFWRDFWALARPFWTGDERKAA